MDAPESPASRNTPRRLVEAVQNLAQRLRLRRREPWNWCAQTLAAALLPLGLLTHSIPLLALSGLGLLAGCLPLPLPPMAHTELKRLLPYVETAIGLENAWLARPLDGRKKRQIALWALGAPVTGWLLWQQDLGPIGLALAVLTLLHIRRKNIADGIEP